MAYVPQSGSVVAFEGGYWNASVMGSVAALQGTNPWVMTGSVQGTMSVLGTVPVTQSTSPWIITGSVQGAFSPSGNQSVSGTVNTLPLGTIVTSLVSTIPSSVIVGASIFGQLPAGTAPLGSVATLQGTNPWITVGSVYGNVSGSIAGTYTSSTIATTVTGLAVMFKPNVSSSIMTEISPTWPLPITGAIAASISGNVTINSPSIYGNISGSVVAFQGAGWSGSVAAVVTNTPAVTMGNASVITVGQGSIATVIIGGSILTSSTANQSVSGAVQIAGASPASIMTVTRLDNQVVGSMLGMVGQMVIHGLTSAGGGGYVDVKVDPSGALVTTAGSVVTFQGTSPWVETFSNSSILAVPVGSIITVSTGSIITTNVGSVITVLQSSSVITTWKDSSVLSAQQGTWRVSVAGFVAANSASIISNLGPAIMGVRNDTMASVLATADGFYGPYAQGSWGDMIVSPAPAANWVTGIGSVYTGVPQPIITSVSGKFINITGVQVANASANNVYLTFYGTGLGSVAGSIIGYTVAPANGGSNILFPVPLRTAVSQPFQASVSGVSSILLSAQGYYSKV